jgi:hypothetical protein
MIEGKTAENGKLPARQKCRTQKAASLKNVEIGKLVSLKVKK